MPIRSPRRTYFLFGITKNLDNVPDKIDTPADEDFDDDKKRVYAKIKQGVGDYLGLVPLAWNDDVFEGTFSTEKDSLNNGYNYRRNIGGFKVASYKLVAKTFFNIQEEYLNEDGDSLLTPINPFRTISIGMPKGHSVNEFINWVMQQENSDQIRAIVTPAGKRHDMYKKS